MNSVDKPFGVVLLIGGCGFIGHYIVRDLIEKCGVTKPSQVHIYDSKIGSDRPFYSTSIPSENYHQGDICDTERLTKVLQHVHPTVIFDLVSPPMFDFDMDYYMQINVSARQRLLDAARSIGTVKAFVFNSSAGVVHDSYSDLYNADETFPVLYSPEQREPYSHSKAFAETMVLQTNKVEDDKTSLKMLTAAVRLSSPFGDNHGETTNVILENARAGKQRFQIGDGKNLADWTYIENGARGHTLVAQALLNAHDLLPESLPPDLRVDGEAFFITNGEPRPFWEFARSMGAAAGYVTDPSEVRVIPKWVGMMMAFVSEWSTWLVSFGNRKPAFTRYGVRYSTINKYYCIDKARRRLKYDPEISLDEGIRRSVVTWVENNKKKSA